MELESAAQGESNLRAPLARALLHGLESPFSQRIFEVLPPAGSIVAQQLKTGESQQELLAQALLDEETEAYILIPAICLVYIEGIGNILIGQIDSITELPPGDVVSETDRILPGRFP
jgi:hypothetical protein